MTLTDGQMREGPHCPAGQNRADILAGGNPSCVGFLTVADHDAAFIRLPQRGRRIGKERRAFFRHKNLPFAAHNRGRKTDTLASSALPLPAARTTRSVKTSPHEPFRRNPPFCGKISTLRNAGVTAPSLIMPTCNARKRRSEFTSPSIGE
jgi:hypothetical protein